MQTTRNSLETAQTILHFKIRAGAIRREKETRCFDSVEELCSRLNRLQSKTDSELSSMGLERAEIGSYVLNKLLN